jgi:hypothetical protein
MPRLRLQQLVRLQFPLPSSRMKILPKIPPDKEFIKFCNSLRCPLCSSQLDGGIHPYRTSLYCAANNAEYRVTWVNGMTDPEYEEIVYWFGHYRYNIRMSCSNNTCTTIIDRYDTDMSPLHINSSQKRMFKVTGPKLSFFRKRMDEATFISKLSLYNVFS